jgi:hypothetical protein
MAATAVERRAQGVGTRVGDAGRREAERGGAGAPASRDLAGIGRKK